MKDGRTIEARESPYHPHLWVASIHWTACSISRHDFKTREEAFQWAKTQPKMSLPSWEEVTMNGRFSCE